MQSSRKKRRGTLIWNLSPPLQERFDYTPLDNQPMTGSIGGTARSRKSQYLTTLYFLGNALLGNPDVCFNELFTTWWNDMLSKRLSVQVCEWMNVYIRVSDWVYDRLSECAFDWVSKLVHVVWMNAVCYWASERTNIQSLSEWMWCVD